MYTCAEILKSYTDFTTFSKKHTDVKTFDCKIELSSWELKSDNQIIYHVKANRFLRGMVKALVGTQLQVARGKITIEEFKQRIEAKECNLADFSPSSEGLFLEQVYYPESMLTSPIPYK